MFSKLRQFATILACLALSTPVFAQQRGTAGEFDYYVMALSWSPNWCALEGDRKNSPQCDAREDFGWVLHGLWPQYERGWPQDCRSRFESPSRAQTAAMADIMGTSGLAWYQWNKHGVCARLPPRAYFDLARQAYDSLTRPRAFERLSRTVKIPASLVEEAFIEANPALSPEAITVTCKSQHIQEVRICLTKDLEPRECGADMRRDCTLEDALFTPIR